MLFWRIPAWFLFMALYMAKSLLLLFIINPTLAVVGVVVAHPYSPSMLL
jgi:hypothetical protein